MQAKLDVYSRVTDTIIAQLENGVRPWIKPWDASHTHGRITLPCRHNGVPYRGINILLLSMAAIAGGYTANRWLTFKQCLELGGHVRKGEHGSLVVFASTYHKTETADDGAESERDVGFLKAYTVFNECQVENLPPDYQTVPAAPAEPLQLIEQAEQFFAGTGATFRYGGNRAYYSPSLDLIQMPPAEAFRDAESFAATKAHELIHLTSHPTRLDRVLGKRFGDTDYIIEELIAETGAAFLCAQLGITAEVREDHAAYLDHWIKCLKADKRAIFTAASHAQKACDYLFARQNPAPALH